MPVVQSLNMSPDEETEVVLEKPKRTPRKRAPKVISDEAPKKAPVKRAPRKTAPKKEEAAPEPDTPKRKAPTPIASEKVTKRKGRRQAIIIGVMILVGICASAVVGFTDKGQIDVEGTIAWRNEEARSAGRESAVIPVQNTPQLPDGGLIGMGIGGPVGGNASTTEPTASSTPPTASSTEPVGQSPLTNAEAEAAAQSESTETPSQ
jgi:hypothetical protein